MRCRLTLLLGLISTIALACGDATLEVDSPDDDPFVIIDEADAGASDGSIDDPMADEPDAGGGSPTPEVDMGSGDDTGGQNSGCSGTEEMCSGTCVDTTSSDMHCGACGEACPSDSACTASECVCDQGEMCAGACVDTNSNTQHCGTCDNSCSGGMLCLDGNCEPSTEVNGVLQATNQARSQQQDCGQYGMAGPSPPLEGDTELHEAAQMHADDMAENNFFSHTGSDGSSFADRVGRTDFSGFPIGENIAGGGSDPAGVVARWIDSDGHCRNLMNPNATKLGVGYAAGGQYGTLWVQVFGR